MYTRLFSYWRARHGAPTAGSHLLRLRAEVTIRRSGDHDAYEGPVFNYVLRMLSGDRALAEDMCQEVFLRVYQALPGFNLRCRFTTWLFQVAKHRVLDELRARGRRAPRLDIDTPPQPLLAREPVVGVEDMDAVFRAIGSLSDDLKMALVLRDVVGLSYNEIAETLEMSLATQVAHLQGPRDGGRRAPPRRLRLRPPRARRSGRPGR